MVWGINVRSNLDFDDAQNKPRIIERVYALEDKNNNAQPKIGVVCASGGCNTTTTSAKDTKGTDSLSADVVVQVQVNANDAKTNKPESKETIVKSMDKEDEDIPDVPVVIGYGGGNAATPQEHIIRPDNPHQHFHYNQHNFPQDHVRTGGGFVPSLGVSVEFKPRGHYPNDYTKYHTNGNGYGYGVVQRPSWNYNSNPAPWYRRVTAPPPPPPTTCICHPNSVWSGTTPPPYVNFNNPGKQINDKLAPLH